MMDLASILVQAAIAVVSAAAGVTVAAWKLSKEIEGVRRDAQDAIKKAEDAIKKCDKLEADFDSHLKAEAEAWNETANQLGRIQGAIEANPPPMRPPRRSRPG